MKKPRHGARGAGRKPSSSPADNLVLGRKPVLEMILAAPEQVDTVFLSKGKKSPELSKIMDACRKASLRFQLVDMSVLDGMAPGSHQGAAARIFDAGYLEPEQLLQITLQAPLPLIVALDQVQDPGNAGTLARTLYALGGGGLLVPKHNAAFLGAAAAKASMGALARLPVARATNLARSLEAAPEVGYTVYGAALGPESRSLFTAELKLPAVLVLGSEEKGLRPSVAERCDILLEIPLAREFDSLNVAQAGAIILGRFAALGA